MDWQAFAPNNSKPNLCPWRYGMVRREMAWGALQAQWSAGGDLVLTWKSLIWRRFSTASVPASLGRPLHFLRQFRTRPARPHLSLLRKSELYFLPMRRDSANLPMKKSLYLRSTFLDLQVD